MLFTWWHRLGMTTQSQPPSELALLQGDLQREWEWVDKVTRGATTNLQANALAGWRWPAKESTGTEPYKPATLKP
jgi:hypothetical protein